MAGHVAGERAACKRRGRGKENLKGAQGDSWREREIKIDREREEGFKDPY